MALGRTGNWLLLKQRCYAPSLPVQPLPSHPPSTPYPTRAMIPPIITWPHRLEWEKNLKTPSVSLVRAWRKNQKGSILPLPLPSHLFQVREGELEVYSRSLVLRLWEFVQLVLIFHGNSFQWHWTKLYYNKKEIGDRLMCYFTRSQVGLFGDCLGYLTRKQEEDDVDAIKENSHAELKCRTWIERLCGKLTFTLINLLHCMLYHVIFVMSRERKL